MELSNTTVISYYLHVPKLWSVSLKRHVKLVVVKYKKHSVNLFSTDVQQSAADILEFYRSRFTIEFLIRDAKQSAGLEDCQARDQKALECALEHGIFNRQFGTPPRQRTKSDKAAETVFDEINQTTILQ
jgi:hypothetical protein